MLVASEIDQSASNCEFALGILGHALFVDGQGDHCRAEFTGELDAFFGGWLAILEINRVQNRLTAIEFQGRFQDNQLRRVNDQRCRHCRADAHDHL